MVDRSFLIGVFVATLLSLTSVAAQGTTTIPAPASGGTGYIIGPAGTTPFFSAPSTFTPTATGQTPGPGVATTLTNASPLGEFSFTQPFSSVPPTGSITDTRDLASQASRNDLQPTPDALQSAPAGRLGIGGERWMAQPLVVLGAVWVGGAVVAGRIR